MQNIKNTKMPKIRRFNDWLIKKMHIHTYHYWIQKGHQWTKKGHQRSLWVTKGQKRSPPLKFI